MRTPVIVTPAGRPARLEAITNHWYEASRWSPHRSFVWEPVQNARKDLDRYTRHELVKYSRYLYKNSPLIRGLIERLTNLTIGSGIRPVPTTSSRKFNQEVKAAWKRACKRPCVDSRMHMGQYQRVKARERFLDGEGLTVKTWSKSSFRNAIQGLETDYLSAANAPNNKPDRNVDGVLIDGQGAPIGYQIRGAASPYPADDVVHHFTPIRSGQYRGEPILASAINTARDVDDILALEKQAVKSASATKDIIQTETGEIDPETLRKMDAAGLGAGAPEDEQARNDYYRLILGAQAVVLQAGDKYTPYQPGRPGGAWQGFMDFLAATICLSTGIPASVLLPIDIGGTDIRRDLELAQRIITPWQDDIASEFQEIYEYFVGGDIDDGLLTDPPDDWESVRWHFPKSITVDRGRDAQQDRADVMAGLMSREEYHARYGDDGDEYEQTVVTEARQRRFLLFGTPLNEPFMDLREYVQIMSLDSKLFTAKPEASPQSDEAPGNPNEQTA